MGWWDALHNSPALTDGKNPGHKLCSGVSQSVVDCRHGAVVLRALNLTNHCHSVTPGSNSSPYAPCHKTHGSTDYDRPYGVALDGEQPQGCSGMLCMLLPKQPGQAFGKVLMTPCGVPTSRPAGPESVFPQLLL